MKIIISILLIVSFSFAANYYCRADGTAANMAAATGPTSDASKCASMTTFNAGSFAAGDSIKFSNLGGSYTTQMTIPSSGASLASRIIYCGIPTDTPTIDVSANAANAMGIYNSAKDYIEINLFKVKGSGGGAAVYFYGDAGYPDTSITVNRIIVLSNYGASSGNNDCFNLYYNTTHSPQVVFWNCEARGCHENPVSTGSHQGLTTHSDAIAIWHNGLMDSCNYWVTPIGTSSLSVIKCTMTNYYRNGLQLGEHGKIYVDSCDMTDGPTAVLCIAKCNSVETDALVNITNSSLRIGYMTDGNCANSSTLNLVNDSIFLTSTTALSWRAYLKAAIVTVSNCYLSNTTTGKWMFGATSGDSGAYHLLKNTVTCSGTGGVLNCVKTNAASYFNQNRIINCQSTPMVQFASGTCFAHTVYNNIFYNSSVAGTSVNVNGATSGGSVTIKNNIFANITDAVNGAANAVISNNDYYNSSNEGGAGSITTDPSFIDLTNYKITTASPCYGTGINAGLTTDLFGNPIPHAPGLYSMGICEPGFYPASEQFVRLGEMYVRQGLNVLPYWETDFRPIAPLKNGAFGYNFQTGFLERYLNGAWKAIDSTRITDSTRTSGFSHNIDSAKGNFSVIGKSYHNDTAKFTTTNASAVSISAKDSCTGKGVYLDTLKALALALGGSALQANYDLVAPSIYADSCVNALVFTDRTPAPPEGVDIRKVFKGMKNNKGKVDHASYPAWMRGGKNESRNVSMNISALNMMVADLQRQIDSLKAAQPAAPNGMNGNGLYGLIGVAAVAAGVGATVLRKKKTEDKAA